MIPKQIRAPEVHIIAIHEESIAEGYNAVVLTTERGNIRGRYYAVPDASAAALCVGGVGGGWDSPGGDLYPKLCVELKNLGIGGLRLQYRNSHNLGEAVHDILAGIAFLENKGVKKIALIGHSFGGAAVIEAGANARTVKTVVALASQAYGADSAGELGPHCSLLLLHGTNDKVLPESNSDWIYSNSKEPKQLIKFVGAGHCLEEVADQTYHTLLRWIIDKLNR